MRSCGKKNDIKAVNLIVHRYAQMARSNTIVIAKAISPDRQRDIDNLLRTSKKAFQQLFELTALAAISAFKQGESPLSSRASTSFTDKNNESEFANVKELAEIFTVNSPVSRKAAEFRKFTGRPNIHIGLYYALVASEYAVPSNYITFSGENKHRYVFISDIILLLNIAGSGNY